jgi:threonine synthase
MSNIFYNSTRGKDEKITSSEAIVQGIAKDGGLFVPDIFPKIDVSLEKLKNMTYQELAFYVMKKYLTDFDDEELNNCISKAYDTNFESSSIAPVIEKDDVYFLELYHGPTLAFKDMALSILPHLLITSKEKMNLNKEIVILTATSGDTGKAALEGFADVDGTKIVVFFPNDGVSDIQKRQMITQKGKNTFVLGIKGNFDHAQNGVKEIFNDEEVNTYLNKKNYVLSSANSINIGRLIPQIVYYFYAYLNLLKDQKIKNGEPINVVVPTGNFGNILAASYAKKMGLPLNKLICASNENNVLTDFINTGIYDRKRELILTDSPSMDILVSSNLERLLYELSNNDEKLVKSMMNSLVNDGVYEITSKMKERLNDFYGNFASNKEALETIIKVYKQYNYLMDTHTAVAYSVYEKYKADFHDNTKTVIASTASPYKFTRSVCNALGIDPENFNDFQLINKLSEFTGVTVPENIKDIDKKEIIHNSTCEKNEMKDMLIKILEK